MTTETTDSADQQQPEQPAQAYTATRGELAHRGIPSVGAVLAMGYRAVMALRSSWRVLLMPVATIVMTGLLIALVPIDVIDRLGNYGYLGVFVLTLLASASILMPSPAIAAAWLAGATLNPWLVGLLSGIAAGLGEITGYVAGYTGSSLVTESRWYPRIEGWVKRWGALTVFLLAATPAPLIDLAGIAAGTLRMRFHVYLIACITAKILRFTLVAWAARLLM